MKKLLNKIENNSKPKMKAILIYKIERGGIKKICDKGWGGIYEYIFVSYKKISTFPQNVV